VTKGPKRASCSRWANITSADHPEAGNAMWPSNIGRIFCRSFGRGVWGHPASKAVPANAAMASFNRRSSSPA
jgi:hypothetical protein